MANNLKENIKAHYEWVRDVKEVGNMGYDKAIIDWVKKSGDIGHETVKALKTATAEEAADLNKNLVTWLKMNDETERLLADDFAEDGAAIAQSYVDSMGATLDSQLVETLQSALDPFEEFNAKVEKTAKQVLDNMRSQIEGYRTWGGMINALMNTNINKEALKTLRDKGVAGYEDVHAIFTMTEDQINEFNDLWAQQQGLANEIAGGINYQMMLVGQGATQGFDAGVDPNEGFKILQNFTEEAAKGAKKGLDERSPSHIMASIGKGAVEGFATLGITKNTYLSNKAITAFAQSGIKTFKQYFDEKHGRDIAKDLVDGLKNGITDGESRVISAIKTMAENTIAAAKSAYSINSPSRIFREIGLGLDEGLAQGVDRGTGLVNGSLNHMADSTIQMMNDIVKNISSELNDSPELQPVIRPQLDLTALQNGKSMISGMFGGSYSAQLATSIGPYSNPVTTSINNLDFTPASNADVVSAIGRLRNDVNAMTEQIANMQVVLDGRTVVGELAPAMDIALGTNATRAGRGN